MVLRITTLTSADREFIDRSASRVLSDSGADLAGFTAQTAAFNQVNKDRMEQLFGPAGWDRVNKQVAWARFDYDLGGKQLMALALLTYDMSAKAVEKSRNASLQTSLDELTGPNGEAFQAALDQVALRLQGTSLWPASSQRDEAARASLSDRVGSLERDLLALLATVGKAHELATTAVENGLVKDQDISYSDAFKRTIAQRFTPGRTQSKSRVIPV